MHSIVTELMKDHAYTLVKEKEVGELGEDHYIIFSKEFNRRIGSLLLVDGQFRYVAFEYSAVTRKEQPIEMMIGRAKALVDTLWPEQASSLYGPTVVPAATTYELQFDRRSVEGIDLPNSGLRFVFRKDGMLQSIRSFLYPIRFAYVPVTITAEEAKEIYVASVEPKLQYDYFDAKTYVEGNNEWTLVQHVLWSQPLEVGLDGTVTTYETLGIEEGTYESLPLVPEPVSKPEWLSELSERGTMERQAGESLTYRWTRDGEWIGEMTVNERGKIRAFHGTDIEKQSLSSVWTEEEAYAEAVRYIVGFFGTIEGTIQRERVAVVEEEHYTFTFHRFMNGYFVNHSTIHCTISRRSGRLLSLRCDDGLYVDLPNDSSIQWTNRKVKDSLNEQINCTLRYVLDEIDERGYAVYVKQYDVGYGKKEMNLHAYDALTGQPWVVDLSDDDRTPYSFTFHSKRMPER